MGIASPPTSTTQYFNPQMLYDKVVTELEVVNTVTETAVYSCSIGANHLQEGGILRLTLIGDYLNNSGAGRTLQVKIKFGSTTLYDDTSASIAASATRYPFYFVIYLSNRDSIASQWLGGLLHIGAVGATSGLGDLAVDEIVAATPIDGVATESTASAKTLSITVTHSTNDANLSFRRELAILEML